MTTSFSGGDKQANKAGKLIESLISNNTELAGATPPTYFKHQKWQIFNY